ncbi:MAG: tyrosine-type recombinase/integrase [Acidimicrobiales bacterium]
MPADRDTRDLTVDQAIELFLTEHLSVEKGRADKTVTDYRSLHRRWFSPTIGSLRLSGVDSATMDRIFGAMRTAGLSRSRLSQAKNLYQPFFRWAKRRAMVIRDPMAEFQLPTSTQVSRDRTPREVGQLTLLLATAVEVVPDIAPVLMLGAVTGMRRGELVGIRRSRVDWKRHKITVDTAIGVANKAKGTKTHRERTFNVDLTRFPYSPGCAKGRTNAPGQTVSRHDQRLLVNRPGPAIGGGRSGGDGGTPRLLDGAVRGAAASPMTGTASNASATSVVSVKPVAP